MTDVVQNENWTDKQVSRRRFLRTSAGLAAGAALASPLDAFASSAKRLGLDAVGPAPKQLTGRLTVAFFGAADIVKAWTPIFNSFRTLHPKLHLELVPIPAPTWTGYADAAILQMAGGKQFDILQAAVNIQRLFIGKNVVEPLDGYIARDRKELAPYFADENKKFFQWNKTLISKGGPTYYLPADYNTYCAWVNTKMFSDAGVPVPTDDWTWNDLMAAGAKICTSPDKFLINVDPGDMFFFQPWALTNGSTILSSDWSKSTFANPNTIAAARFAQSLCVKGYSPKPGGAFDVTTEFANDKLAIFGAGAWLNPSVKAAGAAGKAKIVAWPHNTVKGTSVGWNAYPIVKSSKNKEAAWAFLKYLMSTHVSATLAKTGQATPGRKSIFNKYMPTAAPEQNIRELWTSLDYATPTPSPNASDAINQAIIKTLTQIYSSSADPAPLMQSLDRQVTALLKS
jgi:multiple sugar transport system substrate-binding protein